MVAHGTIAFDTLTTSDQVKSGTEKSLDTSYLFNGVAKVFINMPANQASISKSFNVSSLDDDGTGDGGINITNAFSDANYAVAMGITYDYGTNDSLRHISVSSQTTSTIETEAVYGNSSTNATFLDIARTYTSYGDLA